MSIYRAATTLVMCSAFSTVPAVTAGIMWAASRGDVLCLGLCAFLLMPCVGLSLLVLDLWREEGRS